MSDIPNNDTPGFVVERVLRAESQLRMLHTHAQTSFVPGQEVFCDLLTRPGTPEEAPGSLDE